MSVSLANIYFRYPRARSQVLSDVTFSVGPGERVALMGPSGRGKSTLLSIAGLLLQPDSGVVTIDDQPRSVAEAPQLLGNTISWVLQTVSLLSRRSVIDNVAVPLLAAGMTRQEAYQQASPRLDQVGLEDYVWREARSLSGGEAQRVGIARALVSRPSVLLADEPTANLDQKTAMAVAEVLFATAGSTSLLVCTHDPAVAALADRVIHLEDAGTTVVDSERKSHL